MADQQRDDAADARQNQPRRGLDGKGFDAGTGYGGAGDSSAYSGESSWGGQSGLGGSTTRGAYAGEAFGRQGDEDAGQSGGGRRGAGSAPDGADIPRGTDEHSEGGGDRGASDRGGDRGGRGVDPRGVDLDAPLSGERRDPGR